MSTSGGGRDTPERVASVQPAFAAWSRVAVAPPRNIGVLTRNPAGHSRHNLPAAVSSFVGRKADVAAVSGLVAQSRLVTITGAGGTGKTRLALEVATELAGLDADGNRPRGLHPLTGRDGTWIVELAPVRDEGLVAHAVLSELLGPDRGEGDAPHQLAEFLRERRVLLILDNCEHVLAGCVALLSWLFRSCPRLRVLATSREPLRIIGERVWNLQPLPLPEPGETDLEAIRANEAVELFAQRARDVVPGFAVDASVAPAVAQVCRRLDGLPLAIELAAARTCVLSPQEILTRLDDRFRLLTGGSASADARHQTLLAALDWSHDLLSAPEARLFRRLAVFAGSWSLNAAEYVCTGEGVARRDVFDMMGALVSKSLLVPDLGVDTTRYRMQETVRDYARVQLDAAGETEAFLCRHAQWCASRTTEAEEGREGTGHEGWLQRLEVDEDNFRAALAWARDHHKPEFGLHLANTLTWFWQTRGNLGEGMEWLRWALSVAGQAPSADRARAMRSVGQMLHTLGDHESAVAMIDRSVALFREVGEVKEARGCVCQDLFQMCRNPLHAIPLMEDNLVRVRAMQDRNRLAHALANLGLARFFRGDGPGARRCFKEILGLRADGIDGDATDQALMGMARVGLLRGEHDGVEPALREVLEHARRVGDPDGQSGALSLLGELARARGDTVGARALLEEALALAHEARAALSIGRCELLLGGLEFGEGNTDAARSLYSQAMRRVEAGAVLVYHQVRCTLGLADVAAASDNPAVAASLYAEAHDVGQANGDEQAVARSLAGRAGLSFAARDLEGAARLRHQALDVEARIGDRPAIACSFEALATLATQDGRWDRAARLFGAAEAMRRTHGFARPARLAAAHAHEVDRARKEMGPGAWDDAERQGAELSRADALALARIGRRVRRQQLHGWESLTPAERGVIALVADGLTNPQIGERLYISRRTVQHHLGHVFAKLGVTSRSELVREALSHGERLPGERLPDADRATAVWN